MRGISQRIRLNSVARGRRQITLSLPFLQPLLSSILRSVEVFFKLSAPLHHVFLRDNVINRPI